MLPASPATGGTSGVRPAALLAAVSALAALAAAVAVTRAGAWGAAGLRDLPVDLVLAVTCPVVGVAVLAAAGGARRIGWLLVVVGAAAALAASGSAAEATGVSAAARVGGFLGSWIWVPAFVPLVTLLPLLYPAGGLPGPRWRPVAVASVAGIVLMSAGAALGAEDGAGQVGLLARVLFALGSAAVVPAAVASVIGLVVRARRHAGLRRRQISVFLAAACVLAVDTALQSLLPGPWDVLSQAVAVALLPAAVGVALTRHRLYELDATIRRALVAVSLAVSLAGAFVVLHTVAVALLRSSEAAPVVAAAVTGLLVLPLASRLDDAGRRWLAARRIDPRAVAARVVADTGPEEDPRRRPQLLCRSVRASAGLGEVALVLDGPDPIAVDGGSARPPVRLAVRHGGETVGTLVVRPRDDEPTLDPGDVALLEELAGLLAPTVFGLRVFEELRASREALVVAREEERRRLRAELHDGVGAALAGVRLQLDAATDLLEDDAVPRPLLLTAGAGMAEAITELRRVTDDLRPAALDDLGLPGSLTVLGQRWTRPGEQEVEVRVGDLGELGAAAEAAAYRIVGEALANAARHARARRVEVCARREAGHLRVRVSDDGTGIEAANGTAGSGLGVASMRRRTEEIGGTFSLTSSSAGTVVEAVLPL